MYGNIIRIIKCSSDLCDTVCEQGRIDALLCSQPEQYGQRNRQTWPTMATSVSSNGQNDPRNTNSKYTDQEWPTISKNGQTLS